MYNLMRKRRHIELGRREQRVGDELEMFPCLLILHHTCTSQRGSRSHFRIDTKLVFPVSPEIPHLRRLTSTQ